MRSAITAVSFDIIDSSTMMLSQGDFDPVFLQLP